MGLIVAIDVMVVGILVTIALTKGLESALPFFAFVITIVPPESVLPLHGLFQLTTQRVAIVVLAVLWLCLRRHSDKETRSYSTPLVPLILLNILWGFISAGNSIEGSGGFKSALSSVLDFYLVFYIFARTVSRVETFQRVLQALVAALLVCCVFGWFEAYFGWKIVDLFPPATYRFMPGQGYELDQGRIHSSFPHSILFGNALALGIPWALYLLKGAKSAAQKTYLWLAVVLMFWNIYKTMARGPWLALVMSLILLFVFSQTTLRKYLLVIGLMTVSLLVIRPGVWQTIEDTYFQTLDSESARGSSYEYRYTLMRVGREALAKDLGRAAWGFGPDSFYYLHLEGEEPHTGHTEKYESCDSAFVEIMVDSGYVGLLLVMALLFKSTLVSLRAFRSLPKPANSLSLLFCVNLCAYIVMMVSVMNFGWGQQTYLLWILLAMSAVYPRIRGGRSMSKDEPLSTSREVGWQMAEVVTDLTCNQVFSEK